MNTIKNIKNELGDKFTNHIVSMDHNVQEEYDQEFSIHIVCHPIISNNGELKIDQDLKEYIKNISSKKSVSKFGEHIHITAEISKDTLGIDIEKDNVKSKV